MASIKSQARRVAYGRRSTNSDESVPTINIDPSSPSNADGRTYSWPEQQAQQAKEQVRIPRMGTKLQHYRRLSSNTNVTVEDGKSRTWPEMTEPEARIPRMGSKLQARRPSRQNSPLREEDGSTGAVNKATVRRSTSPSQREGVAESSSSGAGKASAAVAA